MLLRRDIRAGLASVSPLDPARTHVGLAPCKVCGGATRVFDLVDANKHCAAETFRYGLSGVGVIYLKCQDCAFVFTCDFDDWSPEDFRTHIYNDDYILVDPEYASVRPQHLAALMTNKLAGLGGVSLLDYGSGAGVFVEAMRARGLSAAAGYDPFSSPARPQGNFQVVTCFEVMEHTPDPVATLRDIASFLQDDGVAYVATAIMPPNIDEIRGRWWYIGPRNGHVSIFGMPSLRAAASAAGLEFRLGANNDLLFYRRGQQPDAAVLAALGGPKVREFHLFRLSPPGGALEEASCVTPQAWHPAETHGGAPIRWAAVDALTWEKKTSGGPAYVEVALDLAMLVLPTYANELKLEIDGQPAPLVPIASGRFFASAYLDGGGDAIRCVLRTPPPVTPKSQGWNDDDRPLTVALRVA